MASFNAKYVGKIFKCRLDCNPNNTNNPQAIDVKTNDSIFIYGVLNQDWVLARSGNRRGWYPVKGLGEEYSLMGFEYAKAKFQGVEVAQCNICYLYFEDKNTFAVHIKTYTLNDDCKHLIKCEKCSSTFYTEKGKSWHNCKKRRIRFKRYCDLCKTSYVSHLNYKFHVKRIHAKLAKCRVCNTPCVKCMSIKVNDAQEFNRRVPQNAGVFERRIAAFVEELDNALLIREKCLLVCRKLEREMTTLWRRDAMPYLCRYDFFNKLASCGSKLNKEQRNPSRKLQETFCRILINMNLPPQFSQKYPTIKMAIKELLDADACIGIENTVCKDVLLKLKKTATQQVIKLVKPPEPKLPESKQIDAHEILEHLPRSYELNYCSKPFRRTLKTKMQLLEEDEDFRQYLLCHGFLNLIDNIFDKKNNYRHVQDANLLLQILSKFQYVHPYFLEHSGIESIANKYITSLNENEKPKMRQILDNFQVSFNTYIDDLEKDQGNSVNVAPSPHIVDGGPGASPRKKTRKEPVPATSADDGDSSENESENVEDSVNVVPSQHVVDGGTGASLRKRPVRGTSDDGDICSGEVPGASPTKKPRKKPPNRATGGIKLIKQPVYSPNRISDPFKVIRKSRRIMLAPKNKIAIEEDSECEDHDYSPDVSDASWIKDISSSYDSEDCDQHIQNAVPRKKPVPATSADDGDSSENESENVEDSVKDVPSQHVVDDGTSLPKVVVPSPKKIKAIRASPRKKPRKKPVPATSADDGDSSENESENVEDSVKAVPSQHVVDDGTSLPKVVVPSPKKIKAIRANPIAEKKEKKRNKPGTIYTCDTCGRPFKNKTVYSDHLNMHTGNRPYICSICNSSFSSLPVFVRHRAVHEEKKFSCKKCGTKYTQLASLYKHAKKCLIQENID